MNYTSFCVYYYDNNYRGSLFLFCFVLFCFVVFLLLLFFVVFFPFNPLFPSYDQELELL